MTTGYNVVDSCVLFFRFFFSFSSHLLETFALISLFVCSLLLIFFPFVLALLLFFVSLDGKQRADSGSNDSGSLL